jgi:predicted ATPase
MVETQPELLAYHLENAGFIASAIDYLRKAGQRAIKQSANSEAIKHLTHALQLLRSTDQTVLPKSAQLALEAMLSQAMIARYGYAAPKTRDMLIAAGALIDDTTEPSLKFSLLYGKWASHYVGGELAKQRSAAAEFLREADRTGDVAIRCVAHRIVGTTHVTIGEFARGLHHLKQSLALYDPKRHVGYRYHYGQDVGAATLCYLSWALWHLGHIDQALRTAREAMGLAEKASHPHTLVYTICHAREFMDLFQRRHQHIQTYANLVVSLCKENGFSHWANCGTIFDGWAAVCGGQVDWGIKLLRKGIAGWQEAGARLWMPMFLKLEAEAYAKAGWDETALKAIEEALDTCKSTALRTKATLLLSTGRGSSSDIESILLNSLEIARNQQARCWELRTANDLSRLWQRDGRSAKALQLLQPLYDQFTEGSDKEDLLDAKILLQNLRRDR